MLLLLYFVMFNYSFLLSSSRSIIGKARPIESNTSPLLSSLSPTVAPESRPYSTNSSLKWAFADYVTDTPAETTRAAAGFATEACRMVRGLTVKQRAICAESPSLIPVMLKGINDAVHECQRLMQKRRWNCSTFDNSVVFGKRRRPQIRGTKERALMHALASAAVVSGVAYACYEGNISCCGDCTTSAYGGNIDVAYAWGACSRDILSSAKFAKRMLDGRENNYTPLSALNLHNNDVGRETIYELRGEDCRCHGSSGSCSTKTCWQTFPKLEKVGVRLRQKYDNSFYAVTTRKRTGVVKLRKVVPNPKLAYNSRDAITSEMFYIEDSPSYCDNDPGNGSLGTRGRECVLQPGRWENCEFLCCGRGYRTERITREVECNCRFKFCCYVECDTCQEEKRVHYCL